MRTVYALTLALAVLGAACGDKKADDSASKPTSTEQAATPAATVTPEAEAEAKQVFETRCVACHGPNGKGDGPASAGLSPKPRDFSDPAWQSSVTDEHIEKIITYGGAAVNKSPAMPANPDLAAKEPVVFALRQIVRDLGK